MLDWIDGLDCGLDFWTGLMDWIEGLDCWTGLKDWIAGLDWWTRLPGWTGLMDFADVLQCCASSLVLSRTHLKLSTRTQGRRKQFSIVRANNDDHKTIHIHIIIATNLY